jgi:hypothetical protein
MKIIVGFTATGKGVYILAPDSVFNDVVRWFEDSNFIAVSQTALVGFEFVVADVQNFSWFTKKKLKSLSGMQRAVAEAFNQSKKYTLMAQNPRLTYGSRDQKGNIVPIFGYESPTSESIQEITPVTPKVTTPPVIQKQQQIQQQKYFPPPGEVDYRKRK